jgi:hypothetical protein
MTRKVLQLVPVLLVLLNTANAEYHRKRDFVLDVDELMGNTDIGHRGLRSKSGTRSSKKMTTGSMTVPEDISKSSKKRSSKKSKRAGVFWEFSTISMDMSMDMSMEMSFPELSMSMPSSTPAPTPTVTAFPGCFNLSREEALNQILVQVTEGAMLANPATAQGMAYRWLLNDDPAAVDPCTYPTLTQRYALATLYFSTFGDSWFTKVGWLAGDAECLWFGVTCGDDNMAIALRLSEYFPILLFSCFQF